MTQAPDSKPGNYYVSVVDGPRRMMPLAGPFRDDHQGALDMVDRAKKLAQALDPKAVFYGFGTCRTAHTYAKAGILNDRLGLELGG